MDAIEFSDAILDGFADQALHVLRLGAGPDGGDEEGRKPDVRVFLARYLLEGIDPEHGQAQEGHQRELVAANR